MLGTIRAFWNDQRGIALILVSVMLPAIIGFSLLVVDMSRVNNLHFDLQKGADALAIAVAAELDGKADSITRANRALSTLVANQYYFSNSATPGAQTLQAAGVTRRYLRTIPSTQNGVAGDARPLTDFITDEVTDASKARYVEVKVTPVGFAAIFPVSFLSSSSTGSFNVGATSVAGFSSSVCDFTPMFICNPYSSVEALGATLRGRSRPMVYLKAQSGGGNAQYGPGDYGFLKTPDGSQATPDLTNMFASTKPLTCYKDDGVETAPGNVPPVNDGINVRFDIYAKNGLSPTTYPPAPNVRKGMVKQVDSKGACSYVDPTGTQTSQYMALPRDNCLVSNTCASVTGFSRLGNGSWDLPNYWRVNHGTSTLPSDLPSDSSRWDVYNYELQHPGLTSGPEATAPQCNTNSLNDPKRRMIYVAIIDCVANQVQGSKGPYPTQAFASIFLTQPAGSPPSADIYGEIVDITTKAGNGSLDNFLRDEAQLYR
ncbi:pilus assembly protein TadG-related protein [Mesorhizobium sp. ESP6-5]|uniref:TadE/TadG family type IV pilus assembly protein n=1 Tax=Mesorhizobium sp. ESP6-5 TaxID=2876623 RepID=UPI001CCD9D70|nr:pilus assembly protein TadG-related protein [Mesorhizobium sp. ESP6-5]MBZ9754530.1 pilus assembly protein TadG-related protein [Mesorhizobium sp. ESP6-5]